MVTSSGMLSNDVKDPNSTLGQYLRRIYPDAKALQLEYKNQTEHLVVDTSGAFGGTIGTAMDLIIRLIIDPDETPRTTFLARPMDMLFRDGVEELAQYVNFDDREMQARAAWALSLCVQAFRVGDSASYVHDLLDNDEFDVETMLDQATPGAVTELIALRDLAMERLIPKLAKPYHLGPSFDLSRRIKADADLISDGLLLEVKTTLGLAKAGKRLDALKLADLYQLLAYALWDHSNHYKINRVGIYSARYGTFVQWPLDHVTSSMSGRTIDFSAAREEMRNLMNEKITYTR